MQGLSPLVILSDAERSLNISELRRTEISRDVSTLLDMTLQVYGAAAIAALKLLASMIAVPFMHAP